MGGEIKNEMRSTFSEPSLTSKQTENFWGESIALSQKLPSRSLHNIYFSPKISIKWYSWWLRNGSLPVATQKIYFSANLARQHISHFSFSLITITFLNDKYHPGCDSHAFTRDSCTYFKGTTVLQLHTITACFYTSDLIAKRLGWRLKNYHLQQFTAADWLKAGFIGKCNLALLLQT